MGFDDHLFYGLCWLSFGVLHSYLASKKGQAILRVMAQNAHRLAYNAIAIVHIAAVMVFGQRLFGQGAIAFAWPAWALTAGLIMSGAGIILFFLALSTYDLGRFSGLRQWREGERGEDETEALNVAGLNRFVRHPLYTAAFLLLWGQVSSAFSLDTAIWGSLYLVIGTYFEERKLIKRFGDDYRQYKSQVPTYIPFLTFGKN